MPVRDTEVLQPWSVRAINLPEHADNVVHTDAGARAAGFPRALVAGVTVYAYLSHVPSAGWGAAWVDNGTATVRFRSPVFEDDLVHCVPVPDPSGTHTYIIEARVDDEVRATLGVSKGAVPPGAHRGELLDPMVVSFGSELAGYGRRAGDDLALFAHGGVHPAVWPVLGNRVTMASLVDGPWIHVRSNITHLGPVSPGDTALIETTVIDRFDSRAGERAVLDARVSVEGIPVCAIEHESIIRLAG